MIKLYHSARTRSTRVLWLLEELGLPYELKSMTFTPDSLKSPEYLEIHPLGSLPAIQDGDLTMFESGAILQYILEKYGDGRLEPPRGTRERGLYLQWFHFAEATVLPPLADIAQHTMFKPEAERVPAVAEAGRRRATQVLDVLEKALAGQAYLLGNDFSAADIMTGYSLCLMKWFGMLTDAHPNAGAYLQRLEGRSALQKALA